MYWIIGNRGMLGKELSHLFDTLNVSHTGTDNEIDITKPNELEKQNECFDWIINCAAYTAVDKAEDDEVMCRALNVEGAGNIARFAKSRNARMIHISTDYVFNGKARKPYRESDETSPTGVYGRTKLEGEKEVLLHGGYVIRTSWLYGQFGNNFVKTMINLMSTRSSVSVVNDQRGNPTWAFDLAKTIYNLTQNIDESNIAGDRIYHYSDSSPEQRGITWYDFAVEIYRLGRELGIIHQECEIKPCTTSEYPTKAERPEYSVLDTTKISRFLGETIPQWDISLKEYLKHYYYTNTVKEYSCQNEK